MLPEPLLEIIYAFRESRVLLTAIEMDVFTAVGEGATAAEAAGRLDADPRAAEMLLHALVALGVLTKHDGVFRNTEVSARYLVADSPQSARLALMHAVNLWPRWSTLTECVRAGTSVTYREMAERDEDWTAAFIAAMHHNAVARAPLVVRAVGVEGVKRMLDLGGGSGAYAIAFAQASEALEADVLDLASVTPIAQGHIERAGLAGRVKTRVGDLRAESYGSGYDLVFISAICHMLDPEENRAMLRKSFEALAPGGRVVVQDFILEADKTAPRTAALFSLNMLVATRAGASYSEPEYRAWLEETGFAGVRHVPLEGPTGLMLGVRPAMR
ncbi:MAG: methyltransferase [Acidobacteriota bacterium]